MSAASKNTPSGLDHLHQQMEEAFKSLLIKPLSDERHYEALLHYCLETHDTDAMSRFEVAIKNLPKPDLDLNSYAKRTLFYWNAYSLTNDQQTKINAIEHSSTLLSQFYDGSMGAFRLYPGKSAYPAYGNARAVLALLQAASFEQPLAKETSFAALKFIRTRLYDPLLGVLHTAEENVKSDHGGLDDAALTALAFIEGFSFSGDKVHREYSDELLRFLFQELWDHGNGGFKDRIPTKEDLKSNPTSRFDLEGNAVALEVCWRLHHLKGNTNYRRWFEWGLQSAWPKESTRQDGIYALARVADMARRGRAHFELVGRMGEIKTEKLLMALRRCAVSRAIVSFVDPDDQDYILAHKLEAPSYPCLFGCDKDLRPLASATDPKDVPFLLKEVLSIG